MDNGHLYPSEYVLKFPHHSDHPAAWHAVVDELQERYRFDWPNPIGTLFAHREASMLAAVRALDAALAEPKLTRQGAAPADAGRAGGDRGVRAGGDDRAPVRWPSFLDSL